MEYVYKYLNDAGDVAYIGITNNMQKRVQQHKLDKLSAIKNPIIYYFPVKTRGDADMLETYLISHYKTERYYNVAKTKKGDYSFLDICSSFPWIRWDSGRKAIEKPFVISDLIGKEKVVEKKIQKIIYVDSDNRSIEAQITLFWQNYAKSMQILRDRLKEEEKICKGLKELLKQENVYEIHRGLQLHDKRRRIIKLWIYTLRSFKHASWGKKLLLMALNTTNAIEQHERRLEHEG